MNKLQEKIKAASKDMIDQMIGRESRGWPPGCLVISYQPERPTINEADQQSQEESSK